jgi:hypothetical protein
MPFCDIRLGIDCEEYNILNIELQHSSANVNTITTHIRFW